MVKFGERVKQLRLDAGMTQEQLAGRIWVSKAAVSNYELSERNPSPETIIKIAKVFGVTTDYLFGLEEKRQALDITGLPEEDILFLQSAADLLKKKNASRKITKNSRGDIDSALITMYNSSIVHKTDRNGRFKGATYGNKHNGSI